MQKINDKATAILQKLIEELQAKDITTLYRIRPKQPTLALELTEQDVLTAIGDTNLYSLYQYRGNDRTRKIRIIKFLVHQRKDETGRTVQFDAFPCYGYNAHSGHEITSIEIAFGVMKRISIQDQALEASFASQWLIDLSRQYPAD